jgi:hypothetical protein
MLWWQKFRISFLAIIFSSIFLTLVKVSLTTNLGEKPKSQEDSGRVVMLFEQESITN